MMPLMMVLNEPAEHEEQPSEDPTSTFVLKEPATHCEQPVERAKNGIVLNRPAPHTEQLVDNVRPAGNVGAVAVVKEPAGQPEQLVAPVVLPIDPKAQFMHVDIEVAPMVAEYFPFGHPTQVSSDIAAMAEE